MPQLVTIDHICLVSFEYNVSNQRCMNSFAYKYRGGASEDGLAKMNALLNVITSANHLFQKFYACLSQDAQSLKIFGQWIDPIRYAYLWRPDVITEGQVAEGALPANVGVTITRRGELANRHHISNIHMGAVPASWVVNSQVVQPVGEPYQELVDKSCEVIIAAGGDQFDPVAYNRAASANSALLTTGYVQTTSRINRRRTVGVGI